MPRAYRPIDEIVDIFGISLSTVNSIIKKYKIDYFVGKWKTKIHAKDFYKVYITYYNPSLFEVWNKKKKVKIIQPKLDNADIFQKLFGSPNKNRIKRKVVATALIGTNQMK